MNLRVTARKLGLPADRLDDLLSMRTDSPRDVGGDRMVLGCSP